MREIPISFFKSIGIRKSLQEINHSPKIQISFE